MKGRFLKRKTWVWKSNNLTKDTLVKLAKIAGTGALILVAVSSPYFLHRIAKEFFEDRLEKAIRARARKLKELKRRKLISFEQKSNGELKIVLSKEGKEKVLEYNLDDLEVKKPTKWDKRWRIIIYDIPQYQRKASDALREKLKSLGLFQLQKSVWISPYECLSELEFVCTVFEINMDEWVHYFYADEIPKEEEARKFFDL